MRFLVLLLVLFSIVFVSTEEISHRNVSAMAPEFSLDAITKKWSNKISYFSTRAETEPVVPFLIERKWIRESDTRQKREAPSKKGRRGKGKPKMVFVVDAAKGVRVFQYVYISFAMITSVVMLVAAVFGILKTGTIVVVRNTFDENTPQRDFPASLTMVMRSKRQGKTPIETTPPEKPKVP